MPTSSQLCLKELLPKYLEVVSDKWDDRVELYLAEVRDISTGIALVIKSVEHPTLHGSISVVYYAGLPSSDRLLAVFSTKRPLRITHEEFMRRVLIKSVS